MKNTSDFARAFRNSSWKNKLGHAWELVCIGAEHGLFVAEELPELIEYIGNGWEYGFDDLIFEFKGDTLQVRFLDDAAECDPGQMIEALQEIERAGDPAVG